MTSVRSWVLCARNWILMYPMACNVSNTVLMYPMALNSTKSKNFSRNDMQYHGPSEIADKINASMQSYTLIDKLTYSIQDSLIIQWCNSIQPSSSSKMH